MQSSFDIKEVKKSLPIFTVKLPDDGILKGLIEEHRVNYPGTTQSNVVAWHSDWHTHKVNPKFEYFVNLVEGACNFISYNHFGVGGNVKMKCENMWVVQYIKGNFAHEHDHFPSILSCAYFVDVEEDSSPLIIEGMEIKPENGMLVIFPSLLRHSVPETHGQRTVISMNFRAD